MKSNICINSLLNPLQRDAKLFVNSLNSHIQYNKYIDENLINALEEVVETILQFIESKPTPIVASDEEISPVTVKSEEKKKKQRWRDSIEKKWDRKKNRRIANRDAKLAKEQTLSALPRKAVKLLKASFTHFFVSAPEVALKLQKIPEYDTIETDLLKAIGAAFPNTSIKIYMFGSRITGTGTPDSDLDIYADIGNRFESFENEGSAQTIQKLRKVSGQLYKKKQKWSNIICIERARVPILTVKHSETKIICDIGFSNSLAHFNTLLIEYLFELQPIMRHMTLLLKKWLLRTNLENNFSSYTIILMVIYFLQINKFLPSIKSLQENLQNKVLIGPWIGNFEKKTVDELEVIQYECTETNVKSLLKLFFYIYADFDYKNIAICPYLGCSTPINELESLMPLSYHNFKDTVPKGELDVKRSVVVQDPLQLNHNVAKFISADTLKYLTACFKFSANILNTNK